MNTSKKISIFFLSMLFVVPLLAPSAVYAAVAVGGGCSFYGGPTESCEGKLICQKEDPPLADCPIADPVDSLCDGVCRDPGSDEAKFGLGTKSRFTGTGLGQEDDLQGVIANIINIVLGFLGIIAVLFILMGGFKIMTAAGNEDKTAEGKKSVIGGVIGLAIVFMAWGIASFVVGNLLSATEKAPST